MSRLTRSLPAALTLTLITAAGCAAHDRTPPTTNPTDPTSCPSVPAEATAPMDEVAVAPPGLPAATMRYAEAGEGATTFVLLHGIPTSSYEWRNVIPTLAARGRVVAPDLIGFGTSEHPDRDVTIEEHLAYLDAFLASVAPGKLVLVVHDLGSVVGLAWAARHADRVAGLVAIEALIPDTIPASVAQSPSGCTAANPDHPVCFWMFLRSPAGQAAIVDGNLFVDGALAGEPCPPSEAALAHYRAEFPTPASRARLAPYPAQVPIDGAPATLVPLLDEYSRWLTTSNVPKLVLFGDPGFLAPRAVAERAAATWSATEARSVGRGAHFLPEVQPVAVAAAIDDWYQRRVETR